MAVYLIRCGDAVKIGYAECPERRISGIQTSAPGKLEVLQIMDGDRSLERSLHNYFADRRITGEWFQYCPEMETDLSDVKVEKIVVVYPPKIKHFYSGKGLKQMMRERGLKQYHVSDALRVSLSSVSKWVHGYEAVPCDLMRPLAEMLGVPVDAVIPDGAPRLQNTQATA